MTTTNNDERRPVSAMQNLIADFLARLQQLVFVHLSTYIETERKGTRNAGFIGSSTEVRLVSLITDAGQLATLRCPRFSSFDASLLSTSSSFYLLSADRTKESEIL